MSAEFCLKSRVEDVDGAENRRHPEGGQTWC